METDKILEYLCSDCVNVREARNMLEQFKDKNNNFLIELLLYLKRNNLDQIEQMLDGERQFRTVLTDSVLGLTVRDQIFYQICSYINIWNLFNKILEIEDEKDRTNKKIQTLITQMPVIKRILFYLYHNPRDNSLNVSKAIGYNQNATMGMLDLLCDQDIIYKISIGDTSVFDLTEHSQIWLDMNSSSCGKDVVSNRRNDYKEIQEKYETINTIIGKVEEINIWESKIKFERTSKFQGIYISGEEIGRVEQKELAGISGYITKYR